MNDDLDDLKAAMNAATPKPDADRRAENIALAMKNFDAAQGSVDETRQTFDRPKTGLFKGVREMLSHLSNRGVLTATTALAALGLVALLPVLRDQPIPLGGLTERSATPEPVVSVEETAMSQDFAADMSARPMPVPAPQVLMEQSGQGMAAPAPSAKMSATREQVQGRIIAPDPMPMIETDTEAFPDAAENPLKVTTEDPVSTFSIDVDTASYAIVRDSLMNGMLPPQGAVRIEEMVNYFPYDYAAPDAGQAFHPTVTVADTPWNTGTQLVHIALQGAEVTDRPPLNLVFLVDTSGSMNQPDKLPLLKQSFRLMLGQLRPDDQVAIVAYAGSAGQVLKPTNASDRTAILTAIDTLQPGGGTAGQAGLEQAYSLAETMADDGDVSRVILATDGDFNVGLSDPEALKSYIADKRDSGTYLSILGFGRGNLDDATMQALAQNGNGQAAYIDTLSEAQKVLVDQLTGALFPIANDVKIQVEFNPAQIAEYRLIGYETRALRREDFNNDKVDAGDIGAGHQVTAIYEVTPYGSDARLTDPLRYGTTPTSTTDELGFLRLRHKAPGATTSQLIETPITQTGPLSVDAQFGIAIAGFGQLLTDGTYLADWSYGDAIALATQSRGADPYGYRQEAIGLMRLAQSLSQQ